MDTTGEMMSEDFRNQVREMGPARFAEETLGYKLSEDQKTTLNYLASENCANYVMILAPRGSGKTLTMAIFDTWLLIVKNDYQIHVLGGSAGQSRKEKEYIDKIRRKNKEVREILSKSFDSPIGKGTRIESIFNNQAIFTSCSTKSSKSPHPQLLILDEMCEAEKESEGAEAVESAFGEIGQSNAKCIMLSTADYLNGKFYEFWTKKDVFPEIARFQWSIIQYKLGNPLDHYTDNNPENWSVKQDITWFDNRKIRQVRNMMDNNWWLVNMLAGLSVGSGNVFASKQLKMFDFSLIPNLKFEEIRMGVDLGFSVARDPTAIVVVGIANGKAWCLFYEEVNIDSFPDLTEHLTEIAEEYKVECIFFDPSASSRPYISFMNSKDYDSPLVTDFMPTKEERVSNLINVVERGKILFDEDTERLVNSLKALHYLKNSNREIAKVNDHGFDALCYCLCDLDLSFFEDDSSLDIAETPKHDYGETMQKWQEMMSSTPQEKKNDDWKIRGLDD